MIKIIATENLDEILGVHIIGPNASDMLAEAAADMEALLTVEEAAGAMHGHPTLSEAYEETLTLLLGRGIHSMKEAGLVLNLKQLNQKVKEMSEKFGFNVNDPTAYIWQLPVGVQQKVEIIKVLMRNARILILDEPTAVLTPQEVVELFKSLKSLVSEGYSIILITHHMSEEKKNLLLEGRAPYDNITEVLITHFHIDHFDIGTVLEFAKRNHPRFFMPESARFEKKLAGRAENEVIMTRKGVRSVFTLGADNHIEAFAIEHSGRTFRDMGQAGEDIGSLASEGAAAESAADNADAAPVSAAAVPDGVHMIPMQKFGLSMEEGTIASWLVKEGDMMSGNHLIHSVLSVRYKAAYIWDSVTLFPRGLSWMTKVW